MSPTASPTMSLTASPTMSPTDPTVTPTVTSTSYTYTSASIEIAIILGLSFGLAILLKFLLEMVRAFDEKLQERLMGENRKKQETNETDEFFEVNGYSWDYVMLFKVLDEDEKKPEVKMKDIVTALNQGGLETELYYSIQRDEVYCKIRASYERLRQEADRTDYKVRFDAEELKKYCEKGRPDKKWGPIDIRDERNECSYMAYEHIYGEYKHDNDDIADLYIKYPGGKNFNGKDRLKLIYTIIAGREADGGCNLTIEALKGNDCIMDFFPLHEFTELRKLQTKWLKLMSWPWQQPFDEIKDYFGEKIGLYFVWLGHYTTWLLPLTVVAVLFWINIAVKGGNPNVDILPYFNALIALWATFFLEFWKRREATISMLWGTRGFEEEEQERPQFEGEPSTSAVDGSPSYYFKPQEQMKRKFVSMSTISALILLVFATIASITFMKIVMSENSPFFPNLYKTLTISIGGAFSIPFYSILPSVANSMQIQILSAVFKGIANKLNDYENHRTDTAYEDALIAKTFAFQFINSYASLFYLAFVEKQIRPACTGGDCLEQLRKTLFTIFLLRLAIGNITEVAIPYIFFKLGRAKEESKTEGSDPDRGMSSAELQYLNEEYHVMLGPFEDYSEMIIQYGFSTLFVSAFPLCLLMSFVNNYVEIRVDGWKLCQNCRRPEPRGAEDIGTWYSILEIMSAAAVITNSAVLCFSSTVLEDHSLRWRIWIFIIMEHVLFSVKFLLAYIVEDEPSSVAIQLERVDFLVSKVIVNAEDDDDEIAGAEGGGADFTIHDEDPV
eukprot:CAMPEP_0117851498 /NCGR_PEP_ID=MMETSP0949-20121206/22438_1 /TAXON_ID=44440 /ORGANISM="Chattonella subsalsa, Strain CCMP2191" /LENGTH=784 /DNA_ID=CAMNT_0005699333 /DNA_START=338 /DNA_END=2692 /DNA_ORIENTATION=+